MWLSTSTRLCCFCWMVLLIVCVCVFLMCGRGRCRIGGRARRVIVDYKAEARNRALGTGMDAHCVMQPNIIFISTGAGFQWERQCGTNKHIHKHGRAERLYGTERTKLQKLRRSAPSRDRFRCGVCSRVCVWGLGRRRRRYLSSEEITPHTTLPMRVLIVSRFALIVARISLSERILRYDVI